MKLPKCFRRSKRRGPPAGGPPIAYTLFVVIVFALAGYIYGSIMHHSTTTGRLVTIHDRGENHVILTHARTVRDALKDAGITVGQQDVVEPSIDSQLLSTDSGVIIYRSRPVLVIDGATREKVITAAVAPNEIATTAGLPAVSDNDKTAFSEGNFIQDGAIAQLTINRTAPPTPIAIQPVYKPGPYALTKSKGAQLYTDVSGIAHRETYYDLPMNRVIGACGPGGYTIRSDGAKIDKDGYILVAANLFNYPRCSVVETSMGPGKVYDTGGFATRYPHGFDLATDWTNYDGR
jgi:hypothetical protein